MSLAANLQTQDFKFQVIVQTGPWRWTTRMDLSQSAPVFSVQDIISPFGILRDTIPIPGEVVQAMSESIDEILTQFPPNILMGPPASLTFDVDEGRGFSVSQTVIITNDGVYGSLLNASLASSAPYLTVQPANIGNLAFNETGQFEVAVDSTLLLAANSPFAETITVQDPNAVNTPQVFSVTINVRPQATIDVSPTSLDFSVTKPISGAFPAIPTQQFSVTNTGPAGSVLDWQVQKLTGLSDDWLKNFTPVSGSLNSGESELVTVSVIPDSGVGLGTFQETLRISGFSTNDSVDLPITLVVS